MLDYFDAGWLINRRIFTFSFWSPSRGPTSTILTLSGNDWVADTLTCQITHTHKINKHAHKRANTNHITSSHSGEQIKTYGSEHDGSKGVQSRSVNPNRSERTRTNSHHKRRHLHTPPLALTSYMNLDLAIIRDQISRAKCFLVCPKSEKFQSLNIV